jgi:hypothetical protein
VNVAANNVDFHDHSQGILRNTLLGQPFVTVTAQINAFWGAK